MESGDVLTAGAADASVRPARAADTDAMGALQLRSWRLADTAVLPRHLLDGLRGEDLARPWRAAVAEPPSRRHAVLVACSGALVVGLAALAPSADGDAGATDAELVALEVDPAHRRAGHGSRLLAAAADLARERGFTALRVWTASADDVRREFLVSAGLHPDGARRRLRTDGPDPATSGSGEPAGPVEVVEERLSAALPD